MFYLLFFTSVLFYVKCMQIDTKKGRAFWYSFIPILVSLILVFSLQYNVGTDYYSYLQAASQDELGTFKLDQFVNDGEYLFAGIVFLSQMLRMPQIIFFFTALVQIIPFGMALYQLKEENIALTDTLFMYFALSLSFFNQFNGIRQYAAMNLIFLAIILLFINPKSLKHWIVLLISPLFHHAAWFAIAVMAILIVLQKYRRKKLIKKNRLYICFFVCFLTYFIDINAIIEILLHRAEFLSGFRNYIGSSYVEKMSLVEIATKIIKLIVVFYSIYHLDTNKLTTFESKILSLSYFTMCLMALSFSSSIIWRIYLFFDLFLVFPVLFFYKYNAMKTEKILISLYLAAFLLAKILLFPRGEYLYSSIIWR